MLGSLIVKMRSSPINPVRTFDEKRSYIVMNEVHWHWATVLLPPEFRLRSGSITKAKELIFLRDFGSGADGRVWLACSRHGKAYVVKFAQNSASLDGKLKITCQEDVKHCLKEEANNWIRVNDLPATVIRLGGEWALVMPYLKPVPCTNATVQNLDPAIRSALEQSIDDLANRGLCHMDLKWSHVGTSYV